MSFPPLWRLVFFIAISVILAENTFKLSSFVLAPVMAPVTLSAGGNQHENHCSN